MRKKKSKTPVLTFLILALLSIASLAVITFIDTSEFVEANILIVEGDVITIGNNCTAIVARTSLERAYSIELGIRGIIDQRPNTHDIFAETLKSFNITLDYVTIDDFKDEAYYANLFLVSDNKILKLDVKPSDGIALALRTNSTIYINRTLLEEIGQEIC